MKKALSLFICFTLILGIMTVPVSAAGATTTNATLWNAKTGDALTDSVKLGSNTSIDTKYNIGAFRNEAEWGGKYDMIGALLPEVISGKTVNLSFDFYSESVAWGAPSFRVDVFDQNEDYTEGRTDSFLGFYSYDAPGNNACPTTAGDYYDETNSYFTYYGDETNVNSLVTENKAKIALKKWQHIDCVYDLVNQKVTYFVDGVQLGTAKGPSKLGALAFRKKNKSADWKDIYYGVVYFDNIKITEVNAGGLSYDITTDENSFLMDFSEPVSNLTNEMIAITDMESGLAANITSVEKITPYQWRANLAEVKENAEYKAEVSAITSDFGGTSQAETVFVYTNSAESFGVKKVRYDEQTSNVTTSVGSTFKDDFSSYTGTEQPANNKTNNNDYANNSNGAWSRHGHHISSTSWWGQGTYVTTTGYLAIDNYSNSSPLPIGAIRNIGSNVKGNIFNASFKMAYYNESPHETSYFTVFADDIPVISVDRQGIYFANSDEESGKVKMADYAFAKANYGKDLADVSLSFDFTSKIIKVKYGDNDFYAPMTQEMLENGFSTLKFVVNLTDGINNNGSSNGTYRGNAALIDNYSEEIINVTDAPSYNEGLELGNNVSTTATNIDIEFTDAVNDTTIGGITITDAKGNNVAYTPSWSTDKKTLSLGVSLKQNTAYTLAIPTTVQAEGGSNNARAYSFPFQTGSAIKFYDANGDELTQAELKSSSFAKYEISAAAPTNTADTCVVLLAIYNEADNSLDSAEVNRIPYKVGDIIEFSDEITVENGKYAKVFFWKSLDSAEYVFEESYSVGK